MNARDRNGKGKDGEARATVEQLRHAIDSGRTGDKVRGSDPAAAPLGSDDEAAGFPVTAGQAAHSIDETVHGPRGGGNDRERRWDPFRAFLWSGLAVVIVLFVALMLWLSA